ncbi:hypothetical protein [Armatimonas sp.]|uniref:hypothetical protein n=1 Tax=Armatimonas sp. TaxID=1872638 RepID=UPI00286A0F6D|nr:hypothetical protein [Armatimonas sp.]
MQVSAMSLLKTTLLLIVLFDVTAIKAHAYIDPGAGSYAFQVALAGVAGLLVSSKLIIQKIRFLFSRMMSHSKEISSDSKDSSSIGK